MTYSWRGGDEHWFRIGAHHPHQVMWIEPLFEEKNRCRRLIATVMRRLDARGIGSVIPDLPGTGESLLPIENARMVDWRDAVSAAAQAIKPVVIAALRGGALIDDAATAAGHWRLAPETGTRIVRDLRRAQMASEGGLSLYAGHRLSDHLLADLDAAAPLPVATLRTIRLESDAGDADTKIAGIPLWRRAEPGEDVAQAAAIADDLAHWVQTCAAS